MGGRPARRRPLALAVPEESHDVLTQGLPEIRARLMALCLALSAMPLASLAAQAQGQGSQAPGSEPAATVTPPP